MFNLFDLLIWSPLSQFEVNSFPFLIDTVFQKVNTNMIFAYDTSFIDVDFFENKKNMIRFWKTVYPEMKKKVELEVFTWDDIKNMEMDEIIANFYPNPQGLFATLKWLWSFVSFKNIIWLILILTFYFMNYFFIWFFIYKNLYIALLWNRLRSHWTYSYQVEGAPKRTYIHVVHADLVPGAWDKWGVLGRGLYRSFYVLPSYCLILTLLTIFFMPFYSVVDTFYSLDELKVYTELNNKEYNLELLKIIGDDIMLFSDNNSKYYIEGFNETSISNGFFKDIFRTILPYSILKYIDDPFFEELYTAQLEQNAWISYVSKEIYGNNGVSPYFMISIESFNIYTLDIMFAFLFIYLILFLLNKDSFSNHSNTLIPNLYQVLSEMIYKTSLNLFVSNIGKKIRERGFFIKVNTILIFILISNVQGMIPYMSTLTSSLTNTFFVALALFSSIIITIFKKKGWRYFLCLFMPEGCPIGLIFLLIPIEIISYTFRVVSLSVRLFANMMAGHTLLKVIVGFSWEMVLAGEIFLFINFIPVATLFILTLLEVGVAFIQTYIFTILTCIYLKDIFFGH